MLDVVFPVSIPNVDRAVDSLTLLERRTDVPARLIVVVDGGTRSDFAALESFLRGSAMKWILLHEEQIVYLNRCVQTALGYLENKLVAFMQPHVLLADDRWFGKMQQVLMKDQLTGIVDTIPNTGSSAMMPVRRSVHRMPEPGCALALLTSRFLTGVGAPPRGEDLVAWWARKAVDCGGSSWHAGGVSYSIRGNAPHILWRAPSVDPVPSKLQSQTTQGSSTRTTTGKVGSLDSGL